MVVDEDSTDAWAQIVRYYVATINGEEKDLFQPRSFCDHVVKLRPCEVSDKIYINLISLSCKEVKIDLAFVQGDGFESLVISQGIAKDSGSLWAFYSPFGLRPPLGLGPLLVLPSSWPWPPLGPINSAT